MWALGMPNPPLWGVLIFFLEFVPYLGAFVFIAVLILAAVTTFDSLAHALLVPATYLAINLLQAYAITPMLLGRRLTLNPVAILVGLILWFQIWGIAGAFIAVPLLSTFKIVCDHIETLAPVGEFLGD
jgi:predicted PurR-regulated permease PerM